MKISINLNNFLKKYWQKENKIISRVKKINLLSIDLIVYYSN